MRTSLISAIACLSILCAASGSRAEDVEIVARGLQFPEGTLFVGNTLYFVDYSTSDVLRLAGDKVETVWHQDGCGANGLGQVPDGLLVACYDNNTVVAISLDGKLLDTFRTDDAGRPFTNPNDFAADRKGGIYFTGSGSDGADLGKVYYLAAGRSVKEVAGGIHFANGLAVSPDGKLLYVAETKASRLLVFAIVLDGTLGERREFVKLADILADGRHDAFSPDGVRIDKHGNLFVALYNGGGLAVVDPNGKLVKRIDVPATHHTNLAITPDGKFIYATAIDDLPNGSYRGELYRVPNPVAE
jgi:gluconolactonase